MLQESLPPSTCLVPVSVLLGMNKANVRIAKQNWAGQKNVNLIAYK